MTNKMNKIVITYNYLDKGFQKLFFPSQCLHHLFFSSKFSIEYNCIRTHTIPYYVFSFIGILGIIIFHLFKLNLFYLQGIHNEVVRTLMTIHTALLIISYVLFYIINFTQRKNYVAMILNIQKAYRIINFKYSPRLVFWSWVDVFRPAIFLVLNMILVPNLGLLLHLCSLVYFDLQIGYGISIIKFLKRGISTWISELENFCAFTLELGEERYSGHFKKLFEAYENLMTAYETFKTIFKYAILFQAVDTFLHSLVLVKGFLELSKTGATQIGLFNVGEIQVATVLWLTKNIAFVSIFSGFTEYFYLSISEINNICTRWLMSVQNLEATKKLCKNVLRLNRAGFHKMRACRIFTVDAGLAQAFNSLEVEYMVILLQIALKHND